MTTFLEHVCVTLYGPPTHHEGECPCWPCPHCAHRSWHVRPPRPGTKDRFSCWSCGWWGDEHDLLREVEPALDYGGRLTRLNRLRQEYEAELAAGTLRAPTQAATSFSPQGRGGRAWPHPENAYGRSASEDEFSPAANEVVAALREALGSLDPHAFRAALRHMELALEVCSRYGLHPSGLGRRLGFEARKDETDEQFRAECSDPAHCDAGVCRIARGERPLTAAEIRAGACRVDGHTGRKGRKEGGR